MKTYHLIENKGFIGRYPEKRLLDEIAAQNRAAIIIAYGRRRIGKTELIEQTYRKRNLIKFEGLEGQDQKAQMAAVMQQLAEYAQQPLLKQIQVSNWIGVFTHIFEYTKTGEWTLYFEEVQWLADYQNQFISELKFFWDNYWQKNPGIILILCGSSPSFMINQVAHSKALYNRSQYELSLKEFNLLEAKQMLQKTSHREIMDAYLSVGGVPAYLLYLKKDSSVFLSLCKNSFKSDGFFTNEYQRIFISSLADNPHYKKIIEFLSKRRFATRNELLTHLRVKSGGSISNLLIDLEECGFIRKYTPFYLDNDSMLARYCIQDAYLQFYFKFIKPISKNIKEGMYENEPAKAIKTDNYYKWLGYAFERFCRRYHYKLAKILGFSAVHYRSGVYFSRQAVQQQPDYQIDLVFDRDDHVITLCEIKYLQSPADISVITEFDRKLALFPNPQHKQIHKVLISSSGANPNLISRSYFDDIITLDDLFNPQHWAAMPADAGIAS